jgi:hypothetical protein
MGQQRQAVEKLMRVLEEGDTLAYKELPKNLLRDHDSVNLLLPR